MGERGLDPVLPLGVRLVGWLVGVLVGGRGGLNLRTAIPKGALVAEKVTILQTPALWASQEKLHTMYADFRNYFDFSDSWLANNELTT